jgi:hypothetical protein
VKKQTTFIIIGIAIIITLIYFWWFNSITKSPPAAQNVQRFYQTTGVLRELILDPDLEKEIYLDNVKYQLVQINKTDLKKLPEGVEELYISKFEENINPKIGKCVRVKGHIDTDWQNKVDSLKKDKNVYVTKSALFTLASIDIADYEACDGYPDNTAKTDGTKKVLLGEIKRIPREDPDLGSYDYSITEIMSDEFSEITSTSASTAETKFGTLSVEPANNEIWKQLENNINKQIIVEGYVKKGALNSDYLMATRIME